MCWQPRRRASWRTSFRSEAGQATVESALLVPVLLAVVLLLVEPGIVLYDRIVMKDAAAQGCRILMTASGDDGASLDAFVRRRLGSVPQQDAFHVHHGSECSWVIVGDGGPSSGHVSVTITNEVKPLPLIGFGAALFGAVNEEGNLEFSVTVSLPVQDGWVYAAGAGPDPVGWIGAWTDDG